VKHCGVVILAAGKSSRLGTPKQLLSLNGQSLLQHTIDVALQTSLRPVVVVLGANKALILPDVIHEGILVVDNVEWEEGMASSLRKGLQALILAAPSTDAAVFMVCDQPFVTKAVIDCLMEAQALSGMPIAASSYGEKIGTPALFHQSFFDKLMQLKGDTGARKLLEQYKDQVATVPFEKGIIDIDTKEDYERFLP
jgi:molybdenum cofactor cytidylyltransferase